MDAAWTVSRLVAAAVSGGWDDRLWYGGGWWWWWLWWLVMVALSIGFAAAVVWLMRRGGGPGERPGEGHARQILAERDARGEISADEYHERIEEPDR